MLILNSFSVILYSFDLLKDLKKLTVAFLIKIEKVKLIRLFLAWVESPTLKDNWMRCQRKRLVFLCCKISDIISLPHR